MSNIVFFKNVKSKLWRCRISILWIRSLGMWKYLCLLYWNELDRTSIRDIRFHFLCGRNPDYSSQSGASE